MTAPRPPRPTYGAPSQAPVPRHVLVPAATLAPSAGLSVASPFTSVASDG